MPPFTCNIGGSFAIAYSGKSIPWSKVQGFTYIEHMDTGIISYDAVGQSEANTSRIKTFQKVDFEKSAKNIILPFSYKEHNRTTSTQTFQKLGPNFVNEN